MPNGIYEINFKSSLKDFGKGLVVIKDGSLNGGDLHLIYRGQFQSDNGQIHAQIIAEQRKPADATVADIERLEVDFAGNLDASTGNIFLAGAVTGRPNLLITAIGKKLAATA
ncbi:hypothetical protein JQX08_13410 [Pseudomonas sp. UL073]|uniref:Negative regulator GrlR n=1 Tax=Zestomonas insulae TaxID=2809017 RepID=A0ABS2IF34_9GAMM|nr:GrlR family regulatory protein [Pseudomonas insulae]MBM7061704.1 hypothetical protein [Pseudomonas insulae]